MKRIIGFLALVLAAVSLFAACDMASMVKLEHEDDVKLLLAYLSEGDLENAGQMMHADKEDISALEQISEFLDGRKVKELKTQSVHVKSMKNNGVSSATEEATFKVTLDDGETVYLSTVYTEDDADQGFTTFRLALGN